MGSLHDDLRRIDRELYIQQMQANAYWRQKNKERWMLSLCRSRAKIGGYKCDLEESDFKIPVICPVFGIPLDSRDRNHTPSIDRIDNSKGYVKGNICIISCKANFLKRNGTIENFEQIITYMKGLDNSIKK